MNNLKFKILMKTIIFSAWFVISMLFFSFTWLSILTTIPDVAVIFFSFFTISSSLIASVEMKGIKRLQGGL